MTTEELLKQRNLGEVTKVQFKERILESYDIGCEMVAMSNSYGGQIIVGISDKTGEVNPLSYKEVQEATNLLSNIASQNVVPAIVIEVDTVAVGEGIVVVATLKEGVNKPYHDNKGIVWVKSGADKRKVFDNAELAEMMAECGNFTPDEAAVRDATMDDLDEETIKLYLLNRFGTVLLPKGVNELNLKSFSANQLSHYIVKGLDCKALFRNLRFIRSNGALTVAAMLLFGKAPQRWLPVLTAKCISFVGDSVGSKVFRDKVADSDMEGNLLHQYHTIMAFFKRNLRNVQVVPEFNSLGEMEIAYESLVEFVVNALVHRSLNRKAPIRIFIFDNRVEIHSPGRLSNGLTIADVVNGTSLPRNIFLFTNAIYLLPYTGAGSGIRRALETDKRISFKNDEQLHEFLITIERTGNQETVESNHQTMKSNHQTMKSNHESNQEAVESNHQTVKSNHESNHQAESNIHPKIKLTKKQEDIRNFCSVPRTSQEIMDRIGISNQSKNRQRHIVPLIEMGVIEMTIPDNPKDKMQKYRKR